MPLLWTFFAILHLFSILFALIALYRLYDYIKRYRFSETKYTLLFSFIHLKWIAAAYIITILVWVAFSYIFITYQG